MSRSCSAGDWSSPSTLTFEPPDLVTFRCLDIAYAAGRSGGTAPAWLSAANEVAVDAFLAGRIGWSDIARLVEAALECHDGAPADSLESVLDADSRGRSSAMSILTTGRFDLVGPDSHVGA